MLDSLFIVYRLLTNFIAVDKSHNCFWRLDTALQVGSIRASSIQVGRQHKCCNGHGCSLHTCLSSHSDSSDFANLRSKCPLVRLLSLRRAQLRRAPFAGWHIHLRLLQHLPQRIHLLHLVRQCVRKNHRLERKSSSSCAHQGIKGEVKLRWEHGSERLRWPDCVEQQRELLKC